MTHTAPPLDRQSLAWLALALERDRRPAEPLELQPDPAVLPLGFGPQELALALAELRNNGREKQRNPKQPCRTLRSAP